MDTFLRAGIVVVVFILGACAFRPARMSTVFDVRVCGVLGDFHNIQYRTNFDTLWDEYERYMAAMGKQASSLSLRGVDRWLWGQSFHDQLKKDISSNFTRTREEDTDE